MVLSGKFSRILIANRDEFGELFVGFSDNYDNNFS